jgi:hypothetical protein
LYLKQVLTAEHQPQTASTKPMKNGSPRPASIRDCAAVTKNCPAKTGRHGLPCGTPTGRTPGADRKTALQKVIYLTAALHFA